MLVISIILSFTTLSDVYCGATVEETFNFLRPKKLCGWLKDTILVRSRAQPVSPTSLNSKFSEAQIMSENLLRVNKENLWVANHDSQKNT